MSALQHASASTEIAAFLGCCDDVVRKGTQTLSINAVCHRLDHLESEWAAMAVQEHLTVSAHVQALQHYHAVYEVCARTVPLSQELWDRWARGLTTSFGTVEIPRAVSASQLETLRAELLLKYWGLYCRVHWGCACSAKPRLAFVAEEAQKAAATAFTSASLAQASTTLSVGENTDTKTQGIYTVESLESALAVPLHAFARLSFDMSHLFSEYAVVGAVERQWLGEDIAAQLGESAEAAVEALVRRSFKRDLHVPSASLPVLLEEYEADEVEERKAKEIVAVGKATLRSSWMRAASALHEHLLTVSGVSSTTQDTSQERSGSTTRSTPYDDKAYALLEDLLKELRKVPHARGFLPALGVLTHRVAEWQPLSTPAGAHGSGLSGSQTQFYLFLLHEWFSRYIASQHRWSVTDMFNALDDSDLWSFVLERHSFCLTWALATFDRKLEATVEAAAAVTGSGEAPTASTEAQKRFMADMDAKIEKVRAVFYSVVHCLQLYRSAVSGFTSGEKREARLAAARTATHEWVSRVGVPVFCRGLLGDLLDTTEAWEDANLQPPHVQLWALSAEAELKLTMYDTMHLLGCPGNATERLETLVHVALDLCVGWRDTLTDTATDGAALSTAASLFSPAVALVARVLRRIGEKLRTSLATASELRSADWELHQKLVEWTKKLIAVTGAYVRPEELNVVWDAYALLLSLSAPAATADSIPSFISYASTSRRAFGEAHSASGGIDAISWERRNVAKLRRQFLDEAKVTATAVTRAAPSLDNEKVEDAAPVPKKARTE